MKITGKIKELNKIIVSDPSYETKVTCRYENNELNAKNWNVTVEIHDVSEKIDGLQINGIDFFILLSNPKQHCQLKEDGSFSYESSNKIKEIDIGMDSACVAFGINTLADKIKSEKDIWQPEDSLKTLTDGLFGYVKEGKEDGNVNFIYISGYLDEDTDYSIQDVINYITTQLEVKELYQEINHVKFPVIDDDLNDINYEI